MDWHQDLLNGKLPLTIGGGISQSRMAMLFTSQNTLVKCNQAYGQKKC